MSASASRPRRMAQAVVTWTAPASHPTVGPNRRAAKAATPTARRAEAIADGNLAENSDTPPATRPEIATSQKASGGFSSQGRPSMVGTSTAPRAIISRAACATNASWYVSRPEPPRPTPSVRAASPAIIADRAHPGRSSAMTIGPSLAHPDAIRRGATARAS